MGISQAKRNWERQSGTDAAEVDLGGFQLVDQLRVRLNAHGAEHERFFVSVLAAAAVPLALFAGGRPALGRL